MADAPNPGPGLYESAQTLQNLQNVLASAQAVYLHAAFSGLPKPLLRRYGEQVAQARAALEEFKDAG